MLELLALRQCVCQQWSHLSQLQPDHVSCWIHAAHHLLSCWIIALIIVPLKSKAVDIISCIYHMFHPASLIPHPLCTYTDKVNCQQAQGPEGLIIVCMSNKGRTVSGCWSISAKHINKPKNAATNSEQNKKHNSKIYQY